jgi:hypothetical protein
MRFPRFVPLYVFVALSTLHVLAQSPDGNINGLVSDPSSAAVVGAEIVAVNDVTGVQYTTKTNNEGIYVLPSLPPGPYRVQVSKIGFKTIIKPDIILNVQDALSINFTLPIGAAYEVLTVEGGAPLVNTESAAVSTVVDQSYIKNMPLNGRSFQDLILLTPGIVTNSPQSPSAVGQTGEFSVNGQRTEANYYTVDGVSANVGAAAGLGMTGFAGASGSVPASTALGTTQALVSVDDLQEFRVQSSTYSAEYGRNPGGQFAFETKSGANQWHGSAYNYLRNAYFDANDWFNDYFGSPEPAIHQNDFGGTFGGPVKIPHLYEGKDKTFFFVSYEGLRLVSPQPASVSYVPDAALRASAPAPLNQVLDAFPVQSLNGIDDTTNGIAQYIGSWSNPSALNSTSVRFDHVVNDRLRLFFRFSDTTSDSATRASNDPPSANTVSAYTIRTYTTGAASVFSSRFSNEFRFNYSSNVTTSSTVIDSFGGSSPVNLAQLTGLGPDSSPDIFLLPAGYVIVLQQQEQSGAQRQWNLVDSLSLSLGHHRLKFGVDYRRLAPFSIPFTPSPAWFYFSKSALETNSADDVNNVVLSAAHPLYLNFSAFAQDEWRVSQRLTLSLGLRWEVNPAPGVTQGLKPYSVQGVNPSTWSLAPQGTPLWQTTWFNLAPRLGAAYVLRNTPGWETVVRSGGGVFFDSGQQLGSLGFIGPGFQTFADYGPGSFPLLGAIPPLLNPPVPPYETVPYGFATHLQLPFTLQWNTSIEQALGKSEALTISYVGSHASRLLRQDQIYTPSNPNAQTFIFINNGLTSDYESLQVQFRRRLANGLTALASYAWSHCLDYGSSNFVWGYQRGNCDFDIRNNLSAAFSYDLPNAGHNRFANAVLDHWGLDDRLTVRAAFPVTLDGNTNINTVTGKTYFEGLNLVTGQPVYLYGANCASVLQGLEDLQPGQGCPGGRAINPQAFANVTSGFGDAPRNFERGFGAWQMDLAVRRDFPLHERLRLQFRAETFNIFNHPNFGTINANFGQTTFGQATATLAGSLGVLSPLYQMGGPRSMQFALKLVF